MNRHDRADLKIAHEQITLALESIRDIAERERDKFDNMPEGLQEGATGQKLEDNADTLEMVADEIETALDQLEEV